MSRNVSKKVFTSVALVLVALFVASTVVAQQSAATVAAGGKTLEQQLTGKYLGFEGDDRVGFEIGPGADNKFDITIFEEGLPRHGHRENADDRYTGNAVLKGTDSLEIELTKKLEGMESKHLNRKLRKMTANIKVQGDDITLSIPKNEEWKDVSVAKIDPAFADATTKKYPDEEFTLETALYGEFKGMEGQNPITVEIDNPKNGLFPISFFEAKHPEKAKTEKDVRYRGVAILNQGKLQIVLKEKYDDITQKSVERPLRKLTAEITQDAGKISLSIPQNADWGKVDVAKSSQPVKQTVAKPIMEKTSEQPGKTNDLNDKKTDTNKEAAPQ